MTPRELALVGTDERDTMGDEQVPTLAELLDASIHDAMLTRLRMTEKRVERLYALPEIAAMLARVANKEVYGK